MDLLTAYLTHAVEFLIAAVPLILTFILLKVFRQPPKVAACCVALYLPVSVFFWVQLKGKTHHAKHPLSLFLLSFRTQSINSFKIMIYLLN